jgi:hypothetical protein
METRARRAAAATASQAAAAWGSQRLGSLGPLGGSLGPGSFALASQGGGGSFSPASLGPGGDLLGKLTASQFNAFSGAAEGGRGAPARGAVGRGAGNLKAARRLAAFSDARSAQPISNPAGRPLPPCLQPVPSSRETARTSPQAPHPPVRRRRRLRRRRCCRQTRWRRTRARKSWLWPTSSAPSKATTQAQSKAAATASAAARRRAWWAGGWPVWRTPTMPTPQCCRWCSSWSALRR